MIDKKDIIEAARNCHFEDIGFTDAAPFESQKKVLEERREGYQWAFDLGLDLVGGTEPVRIMPEAKTIIVLMELYFKAAYPEPMENHFGRCYLDDDRVTKDRLASRIKAFRGFLRDHGIQSKVPFNLPHRLAAARAGMGTFGKNCLFYSNRVGRKSSWVLPIAVVIDRKFEPDPPTLEVGCPKWCKNVCLAACPTGALKGSRHIDPGRCISFLTYYGDGITPLALREPMGLWVYGCDRCQNVCPRNAPWLAKELPDNAKVMAMVDDFKLSRLLHMDKLFFNAKIWPHMFYMSDKDLWRWKMNTARAMGNTLDPAHVPDLVRAFAENTDTRVLGMIAWALGRIGGAEARKALEEFSTHAGGTVGKEIQLALSDIPCDEIGLKMARKTD